MRILEGGWDDSTPLTRADGPGAVLTTYLIPEPSNLLPAIFNGLLGVVKILAWARA
jgi:hypothetical protein